MALCCLLAGPAGAQDGGDTVRLNFEPRSTRLTAIDLDGLDRFLRMPAAEPGNRLVIFIPWTPDRGVRRFVASRLAAVNGELAKRGLAGEVVSTRRAEGDDSIVLWSGAPSLPATPVERPAPESVPSAGDAAPSGRDEPVPVSAPTLLLPPAGHDGHDDAKEGAVAGAVSPPASPSNTQLPNTPPPDASPSSIPPTPSEPAAAEAVWGAAIGQSLRSVLTEWGNRAGWTVIWQSDREYPVDAAATFSGDFMTAAGQLFDGFATAVPAPAAHFYKGNRVLLVESGEGR